MTSHRLVIRHDRLSEWGVSFVHLVFGLTLLLKGDTLGTAVYTLISSYSNLINDVTVGSALTLLGLFRLSALYINGTRTFTPLWRIIGAISSAIINTLLGFAFLLPTFKTIIHTTGTFFGVDMGTEVLIPNTAGGTYLILAWLDYFSAGRAGFDNGINKRQH